MSPLPSSGPARPPSGTGERLPAPARPVVLLVDDDDAVRRVTARYLALLGYTVVEAGEAGRALTAAEGRVDVVLSDIGLPGMSGPALIEELRSRRPTLRTVLMTGFALEALRPEDWPPGTGLLTKPFTVGELRACLDGTNNDSESERRAS